jgi:hypothetical protein
MVECEYRPIDDLKGVWISFRVSLTGAPGQQRQADSNQCYAANGTYCCMWKSKSKPINDYPHGYIEILDVSSFR